MNNLYQKPSAFFSKSVFYSKNYSEDFEDDFDE